MHEPGVLDAACDVETIHLLPDAAILGPYRSCCPTADRIVLHRKSKVMCVGIGSQSFSCSGIL